MHFKYEIFDESFFAYAKSFEISLFQSNNLSCVKIEIQVPANSNVLHADKFSGLLLKTDFSVKNYLLFIARQFATKPVLVALN